MFRVSTQRRLVSAHVYFCVQLTHRKIFFSKKTFDTQMTIFQGTETETSVYFYAPLEKGAYCFATVGRSVCRSVRRPSLVRSISFDPLT